MFESIINFFKRVAKKEEKKEAANSKDAAKERLHLVLMQDRANVSADFLELMKQEIIEVIKKYIEIDESAIDVRLTNKENEDGTNGAPALYANIPILNIKNEARKVDKSDIKEHQNKNEETTEKNEEEKNEKEEGNKDVEVKTNEENMNTVDNKQEEKVENDDEQEDDKKESNEIEQTENEKVINE